MDPEEIAKKVTLKDLRPIAKEHGIRTSCVAKIDIVRQLSEEVLEELARSEAILGWLVMGKGLRGVTVLVLVIVVLFCGTVSADTLTVGSSGCDYTKIRDAVAAADEGDTIVVCAGSYTENVAVDKRLKLRGEGADVVTVTANSSNDHVLEVTADRVNISGFTVTGAKDSGKAGIYLIDADHCDVSENNASGNRCGIYLNFSSHNTLSNNTANLNSCYGGYGKRGYGYGIYLNSSSNNVLAKNDASSNSGKGVNSRYHDGGDGYGYGIHLCYSSNNTLTSNNASSNIGEGGMGGKYGHNGRGYGYGIYLSSSSNNTLTSNTANSNSYYNYKRFYGSGYGIHLNNSSSNVIYHNNFIDNTHDDALDDCTNAWDGGTEGNYYSDYTGTDLNDDGIGDIAYSIPGDGGSVDNFPLARPWEGHRVSTEVLTVGSSGCDYTKIQDAVDAARVGDTILVYNGSYTENVLVDKRLKLRGERADVVTVRATRSGHEVFEVTADRVSISGFTVTGATGSNVAGIRLYDADHCIISENNAHGNCEGIRLYLSSNNTIVNNTLNTNNRCGIRFLGSNNNVIKDNTLNSNGKYGIHMYSSHNTLTGNTLNSNYDGIYITDSSNNTLVNNTLNSNEHCGIHLYSYHYKYSPLNKYNTLTGNIVNSNGEYGIYLDASVGNIIVNNTANSNKDGIHIDHVSSINNTIHHNSFADNTRYDAYDACHDSDYHHRTNTWDNGTEGNYYSDYPGTDADGNGIGDIPHSIPRSNCNVDNCPLMQAWNGYQVHNLNTDETFLGIQAAIDDSDTNDGHTITVGEGVYRMNVNVDKRLTLVGAGSEVVTVVASPLGDYVFDVTEDYVNISGFMVTRARSGKGIYLNGTDHCTISNNIASDNEYGICLDSSSDNKLTGNIMSGNTYNFNVFFDPILSNFIHDIDTSNLVNGKPVYYWVDQRDRQVPYDAGFVGIVNSTNITVRDLVLTNNSNSVLFVYANNSRIENVTTSNSHQGIRLILSSNNMLTNNNVSGNNCGIDIEASNNNTLTDNTASDNNGYGIELISSSNNTLQGNTANSNNRDGIEMYSSSYNTLTGNSASDNNGYGIRMGAFSSSNMLANNNASGNNGYGIGMYYSSNNMLTGNTASRNSRGINLLDSNNNTLKDNTVNSNNGIGIYLRSSSANTLADNTIDLNEDYGVYMSSSSSNKLGGNAISANDCGIYLNSSSSNTLANNNASSNVDYGIYLCHSSNNKLMGNIANRNDGDVGYHGHSNCDRNHWFAGDGGNGYGYGILLSSSSNNTLIRNTANLNGGRGGGGGGGPPCFYGGDGGNGYGYGILLSSSSNNTLTGNTANLNSGLGGAGGSGGGRPGGSDTAIGGGGDGGDGYGYGIYLRSSSNNMLTGNTANSNSGDGGRGGKGSDIDTDDGDPGGDYGYGAHLSSSSSDNALYHNNLVNNTQNAIDTDTNQWDSGSAGNYYSDYTGADNNTDGIGDDPHPIPGGGGSVDRYPLMHPWSGTPPQKGDLSGDGTLTPADAAIVLAIAVGGSASCDPTTLAAADVNDDGRITSLDALMILQAAAGNIEL